MDSNTVLDNELIVLSRNLYLGADFTLLLPAQTRLKMPQIVANFYRAVRDTRYEERVQILAQEIVERRPHVVCLQEVYEYLMLNAAGDAPVAAESINFLNLLLAELARRSAPYRAVAVAPATVVKLPILWQQENRLLAIQDSVVTLVPEMLNPPPPDRGQVQYADTIKVRLPYAEPGEPAELDVRRAFSYVVLNWQGRLVTVANTHLESISPDVQALQAGQLVEFMARQAGDRIIAGDLNAAPGSALYQFVARAGYADAFAGQGINTWGTSAGMRDEFIDLRMRIDHLFHSSAMESTQVEVFGIKPENRTPTSLLWPSDHAGLLARYRRRTPP